MYKSDLGLYFAHNIPTFFIGFIGLVFSLTLLPFWCYHFQLAISGVTTREDIKFRKHSEQIGMSQNSKWKNLITSWCGPLQPSLDLIFSNFYEFFSI